MKLDVMLYDEPVARILATESGSHYFEYDATFLNKPLPLSPIKLPTKPGVTKHTTEPFAGLPSMICDSLPDDFGMRILRKHFRTKNRQTSPLNLLSHLGDRTVGALTYYPADDDVPAPQSVNLASVAEAAKQMVEYHHGTEINPVLLAAGCSTGGKHPKILAAIAQDGSIHTGANQIPEGMTPWIIKLEVSEGKNSSSARMEYAYNLMAKACGIDTPEAQLISDSSGRVHFATRRFDHTSNHPNQRIHTQTYAAIAGIDYRSLTGSYEHLLATTYDLTRDLSAVKAQFHRIVFNVLMNNCDDHAKNFSFLMDERGHWHLAPAYDLNFANNQTGGQWLTIAGKRANFHQDDFRRLGEQFSIDAMEIDECLKKTTEVAADVGLFAKEAGISKKISTTLVTQLTHKERINHS